MKRAPWEDLVPARARLPYGYTVEMRVVSPDYLRKLAGSEVKGWSTDFGEPISGRKPQPDKQATIYFDRSISTHAFVDTLQHEMHHVVTEWGGHVFNAIVEKGERP